MGSTLMCLNSKNDNQIIYFLSSDNIWVYVVGEYPKSNGNKGYCFNSNFEKFNLLKGGILPIRINDVLSTECMFFTISDYEKYK